MRRRRRSGNAALLGGRTVQRMGSRRFFSLDNLFSPVRLDFTV